MGDGIKCRDPVAAPANLDPCEQAGQGAAIEQLAALEACPRIRVITLPGASYFTPNEEPALVAKLVVEALGRVRSDEAEQRSEHGGAEETNYG